jgi:hypothetical protein
MPLILSLVKKLKMGLFFSRLYVWGLLSVSHTLGCAALNSDCNTWEDRVMFGSGALALTGGLLGGFVWAAPTGTKIQALAVVSVATSTYHATRLLVKRLFRR